MRKIQFTAIVLAVLLVAGCSSSGDASPQLAGVTPTPTSTFETDANELELSADEALWQARGEIAPMVDAAEKRFDAFFARKDGSSVLSRRLIAAWYVCETKGLSRFDVAYAEALYTQTDIGGVSDGGFTPYVLLENGMHPILTDMSRDDVYCKNGETILAMH